MAHSKKGSTEHPTQGPVAAIVAANMLRLRKELRLTAEHLAESMRTCGVPWTRLVVVKLENGGRADVSVDELVALAKVLKTTPNMLLMPATHNGDERLGVPFDNYASVVWLQLMEGFDGGPDGLRSAMPAWQWKIDSTPLVRLADRLRRVTVELTDIDLRGGKPHYDELLKPFLQLLTAEIDLLSVRARATADQSPISTEGVPTDGGR